MILFLSSHICRRGNGRLAEKKEKGLRITQPLKQKGPRGMARSPEKIAGLSRFLGDSHQDHGPSRGGGRRQRCRAQCRQWSRDPKVMHRPQYTLCLPSFAQSTNIRS